MNEQNQTTSPDTRVYWYFEPSDAASNAMIAGLGDRIDECPDKEVVGHDGKRKAVNAFRADEASAAFIFKSQGFKKLSFVLYKQEGDGPIIERQTFRPRVRTTDPFRQARQNRRKKAKQGLPASFGRSVH
jgi:hypothetical protein